MIGIQRANPTVDAVGSDDEVGVGEGIEAIDAAAIIERDPYGFGAAAEDVEKSVPPDADEAMAGRTEDMIFEIDLDIIPVRQGVHGLPGGLFVGSEEIIHRAIGEDDTPAKGVTPGVLLDDSDVVGGVGFLHQDREEQPSWSSTNANDFHGFESSL